MTLTSDQADRLYRCSRKATQRGPCPGKAYITASTMDALAEDLVFAAARRRPQLTRKVQSALRHAEAEVARAEDRLARYRDSPRLIEVLTEDQFADGLQARSDAVREAVQALALRRADSQDLELLKLRGIEKRWPTMDIAARRAGLRCAVDAVFLKPGHGHVEQRVWICERGEAPSRLPVVGLPQPPRAFAFPTSRQKTERQERRLMGARRFGWSDAEIEERLRAFVIGRRRFPTPSDFFRGGERRLYDHLMLRGGGPVWAARVGLPFPQGRRRQSLLWTDERIHEELTAFLAGRTIWPTFEEFREAGREGLRRALVRFGGMQRWAAEFQLPISNFQGPHRTWTEERIETAIRKLIGDGDEWPTRPEFRRAGLDGCYAAMWRTGGADTWARRLGVTVPAERGGRRTASSVQR